MSTQTNRNSKTRKLKDLDSKPETRNPDMLERPEPSWNCPVARASALLSGVQSRSARSNMSPKLKKGQLVSFDFMVSTMLYFTVFLLAYSLSLSFINGFYSNYRNDLQHATAAYAADKLFTAGEVSWTNKSINDIGDIGILKSYGMLDTLKVGVFTNYTLQNPTRMKYLLGAGAYSMKFEVRNSSNHILYSAGDLLNMSNTSLRYVDVIRRYGVLGNQPVRVDIFIWD